MSTYREIVYMCLDELKLASDDAYFNQDHIIFLADKYRALVLKKTYTDVKKHIPDSNYQTLCLSLELAKGIDGDDCSDTYLRSIETLPNTLPIGVPRVSPKDYFAGEITYVSRDRIKYVGHNRYLKSIIYCTIGPDNKMYLKSANPQAYYLENVVCSGIFENSAEAAKLECSNSAAKCDPLDATFPLEEALIPTIIELIIRDLTGSAYKPEDDKNNAKDDLEGLSVKDTRSGRARV